MRQYLLGTLTKRVAPPSLISRQINKFGSLATTRRFGKRSAPFGQMLEDRGKMT